MNERARLGIGYLPQETSIFRKLNVSNRVQAAVKCFALNNNKSSIENELIA